MNHSFPIKNYNDTNINVRTENDDPHTIILDVLKELKTSLLSLLYCLENKPEVSELKSKSYARSLMAIYILQSSLNFDKGGEIAENLYKIYDFTRRSVIEGFTIKDPGKISVVIPLIEDILEAWKDIRSKL